MDSTEFLGGVALCSTNARRTHGFDSSHHYGHCQRRAEAIVGSVSRYAGMWGYVTHIYIERIELLGRSIVNLLLEVRDEADERLNSGVAAFPA